ncbi:MAG: hypothetical protein O7B99_14745 [Planctomycetota bacterium]|nr:hypothetical protein [Planctomycetota bacterium]
MKRVRLIHWNTAEARAKAKLLRAAGYRVEHEPPVDSAVMKDFRAHPPDAVVIDLSRLPGQGRDWAFILRTSKATRQVPIVFVDGDPKKLPRIKKQVPDAEYTTWSRIRSSLKRAIAHPPANPVQPASALAGYSDTPLPKKLGVKPDSTVALVCAPPGFEQMLGKLPVGAKIKRQARGRCDLIVWFARSRKDVEGRVKKLGALAGPGGLWIAWPKQASGVKTDLTQADVRRIGLANGLVDYKIAAIDATWSGLRFTRRKAPRAHARPARA